MATTLTTFKNLIAADVLPCPDPIVNRELMSVIVDFCKRTNILQREFELDVDSDEIDDDMQDCIDFDISEFSLDLRPVAVLDILVDNQAFVPVARNIRNTITNFDSFKQDYIKYFWVPNDHTLRIFDFTGNESKVWLNISVKPVRTVTEVDDVLYEDWSDPIVAGAKFKIMSMPGKEWSDPGSAEYFRREWRKGLSEARSQVLRGASGVWQDQIHWKEFGF